MSSSAIPFSPIDPGGFAPAILLLALSAMICPRLLSAARPAGGEPEGYLGLYAKSNRDVLDERNALEGVTVTRVVENSPAEAAGVKVGDVILQVNGVDLLDPNRLLDIAESSPLGTILHLRVDRDREILELIAITVARIHGQDEPPRGATPTWVERRRLGLEFTAPDPAENRRAGLAPREGILIVRLAREGPLFEAGLRPGMQILELGGETIHSPEGFLSHLDSRSEAKSIRLQFMDEEGKRHRIRIRLRVPQRRMKRIGIPLLFSYARQDGERSLSVLSGLFSRRRIESAVKYRLFWLFTFETGTVGELLEIGLGDEVRR